MKKLLVIMVLFMGALVVNAQRTSVKVSDLPKGVADSIQKEYSGYTIKESARNVENNTTTYEVIVSKGAESKTLHFDNQGKSLKSKGSWDMDNKDKSKTPGTDMDNKDKSKTPGTDMDKSKSPSSTTPSSTTPSSTSPSSTPSSTPSSNPSTTPSSNPSTTPSSSPSSTPSSTPSDATNPR